MVSVLWAYDGWTNATPLPRRSATRVATSRALLLGMAVLITVYVGMTRRYHYVLPMGNRLGEPRRSISRSGGAVYCQHLLGRPGVVAISILVDVLDVHPLNGNG
jgi:hypothetical protein